MYDSGVSLSELLGVSFNEEPRHKPEFAVVP